MKERNQPQKQGGTTTGKNMKEKNTSPAISTNKEGATEVRNASTDMTWRATAEEEKGMKPERDPTERRIGKGTTEKEAERDVTAEGV